MSERIGVIVGGFSESPTVLDPLADSMIQHGIIRDAIVKTAAEYRQFPVKDSVAAEALFALHSAASIALAESFYRDPRKYEKSAVTSLNGAERRGLLKQATGALKVFRQKIEPEEQLPDDIFWMRYPAKELLSHPATTLRIPARVRKFSTGDFLIGATKSGAFQGGAASLYSDNDPFEFTPDQDGIDSLNAAGVTSMVFPGEHNRVLFQPDFAAQVIVDNVPFID